MANVNLDAFDKILVLDFGSQYNQLITRRIRDFGIYSELLSHKLSAEEIKEMHPKGIIFSGGPNSVYAKDAFKVDPEIYKLGIPILGICYGMQLIADGLGGRLSRSETREYGPAELTLTAASPLWEGLPETTKVWMSHGDKVMTPPPGLRDDAKFNAATFLPSYPPAASRVLLVENIISTGFSNLFREPVSISSPSK